jgi:hypothetical protein
MARYPIRVYPKPYGGRDPKKLKKFYEELRLARILEDHLNQKIAANPKKEQMYLYGPIADELSLSLEDVRRLLFNVDCGHNGLTVFKSDGDLD